MHVLLLIIAVVISTVLVCILVYYGIKWLVNKFYD